MLTTNEQVNEKKNQMMRMLAILIHAVVAADVGGGGLARKGTDGAVSWAILGCG
jgi:hypothetical protein